MPYNQKFVLFVLSSVFALTTVKADDGDDCADLLRTNNMWEFYCDDEGSLWDWDGCPEIEEEADYECDNFVMNDYCLYYSWLDEEYSMCNEDKQFIFWNPMWWYREILTPEEDVED